MPLIALTRRIFNNVHLKIISLIIGYGFWLLLSQSHHTTHTFQVPVCMYNAPQSHAIQHTQQIHVTLAGKKSDLRSLEQETVAIHIDGSTLRPGKNNVEISAATLLLPEWISLVHYYPTHNEITVTVQSAHA